MTKKTGTTSNVPHSNPKNTTSNNSSPGKMNRSNSQNGFISSGNGNSSSGVLNSKHLHNQNSHKPKPKSKRDELEPSMPINHVNGTSFKEPAGGSDLMKKLFEAVAKHKETEAAAKPPRTRKGTAPLPRKIDSSETYAGAAFDRAPAATSFPIPSFIKTDRNENQDGVLSSSCPVEFMTSTSSNLNCQTRPSPSSNFPVSVSSAAPSAASSSSTVSTSPQLKSLSVSELFKSEQQQQNRLDALTNDLRKILNLR